MKKNSVIPDEARQLACEIRDPAQHCRRREKWMHTITTASPPSLLDPGSRREDRLGRDDRENKDRKIAECGGSEKRVQGAGCRVLEDRAI